ncbi:tetratricopeptide repeat-containing sulfotransferase family protein [Ferrigenium sp. UT5]|uniref:tetratricopeptide repeat-containing sulfotransferase family protein n=1 Tax=Ferrigenium sp. UT5 TaxID=3242105 RepID=UPI00354CAEA6
MNKSPLDLLTIPIVETPRPPQLSIEQAMLLATQSQSQGNLPQAELLLRQILQVQPQHAYALHLLGIIAHQAGKPELALELIEQAISSNGDVALFHANAGEMYRQLGKLNEAVAHGERAVVLDASLPAAHSNLGIAYFDKKDYERAAACQCRALALDANFAPALNNMGSICRARKDKSAALDWYRKAIAAHPDYLESLSNLGAVLTEEEFADEAIAPLEQALQINPNYAEALCNLGMARNALEQHDAALPLLQRALQLRPNYAEAFVGLAQVFHEKENLEEAERCAQRAVDLAPEKAEMCSELAGIYTELARSDEAKKMFQRALEIDAENNTALLGLGHLEMEGGDMEQAEALFRQALALKADNLPARFHLAQVKKVKAGDENLAALEVLERLARESDKPLPPKKAISLHFALGKCYDDSKQYDKAFPHFLEGCRLKRATYRYDADEVARHFDATMRVFNQQTLERLRGAGDPSTVPIFVLGMPRSGTTLTEQIIASHPEVHGAGELPDLLAIAQRPLNGAGYPDNIRSIERTQLAAWGADYVASLRQRAPAARHITDKMPANFFAVGLIHLMLPNAKIIHVNRNPVDTCLSCFTRLFNRKQEQTYDLAELGRYYVDYARLMEHWRKVLPAGSFLDVQYEEIVANQEAQARRMIEYCGLEWNDACLDFHKHKRSIRTASVTQVRQPIYSSSVERWRCYEKHLGPLLEALGIAASARS